MKSWGLRFWHVTCKWTCCPQLKTCWDKPSRKQTVAPWTCWDKPLQRWIRGFQPSRAFQASDAFFFRKKIESFRCKVFFRKNSWKLQMQGFFPKKQLKSSDAGFFLKKQLKASDAGFFLKKQLKASDARFFSKKKLKASDARFLSKKQLKASDARFFSKKQLKASDARFFRKNSWKLQMQGFFFEKKAERFRNRMWKIQQDVRVLACISGAYDFSHLKHVSCKMQGNLTSPSFQPREHASTFPTLAIFLGLGSCFQPMAFSLGTYPFSQHIGWNGGCRP